MAVGKGSAKYALSAWASQMYVASGAGGFNFNSSWAQLAQAGKVLAVVDVGLASYSAYEKSRAGGADWTEAGRRGSEAATNKAIAGAVGAAVTGAIAFGAASAAAPIVAGIVVGAAASIATYAALDYVKDPIHDAIGSYVEFFERNRNPVQSIINFFH